MLLAALLAAQACPQDLARSAGESIYRHGILPSGQPVTARREGNMPISGAEAACSNCHGRSGLGGIEGSIKIPPISGAYLFRPRAGRRGDLDVPYVDGMRVERDPYTVASLARAIGEGVGIDGKPLNYLMPHFSLNDVEMAALIDYLNGLTPSKVPGVSGSVVNFATIVTPDADPVKRQAMLDVLDHYFADQNVMALAKSPSPIRSQSMQSNAKRRWQLHVWALAGPPASWENQLQQHLAQEPVYAAISGLGGKDWSPVHRFCEKASLPCIFPNVELPVVAEDDFYSLYFSKGVLLEAELLAQQLTADTDTVPRRVVQVFRADDIGEAAAKALRSALARSRIEIIDRPLTKARDGKELAALLKKVKPSDALALWLRPPDIASLAAPPVSPSRVLMSGLMGGLEGAPLPAEWRAITRMAYPVDLPDQRIIRVDYARGWLALHHIPVVAEQVQTDTYVACGMTIEALTHMAGSFVPEYLVERMQGMLEHQLISGYYPRLALAPNERFASKGGYIVHFANPTGTRVLPDTEWRVP
jgi:hypothetical protein